MYGRLAHLRDARAKHTVPSAFHPPHCLGVPYILLTASHPATILGLHYGHGEQYWHS